VLLVDDHPGLLDRVSAMLAATFEVVGAATDGAQALELERRLAPDAVVLDINMPGLDGFATMRALRSSGSRAAVVFLSLLDDDECVREAFRLGGRGYVVKSRMVTDLAAALDHVLVGRVFTPSVPSLLETTGGWGHAAHVFSDEGAFADSLAASFDQALRRGDATCLVAAPTIRDRVIAGLRARGWDVGRSIGLRQFRVIDTQAAVDTLMRDGLPDAVRLAEIVKDLEAYRQGVCAGSSSRLTIAGTLSGSVCAAGNTTGALAIERLWNTHTAALPFFTVCGYSTSCFGGRRSDDWSMTAGEHSAVCHASQL